MRMFHRLYAHTFGYFWIPCPRCGQEFGGHEEGGGTDWVSEGDGRMCCPNCTGDRVLYARAG